MVPYGREYKIQVAEVAKGNSQKIKLADETRLAVKLSTIEVTPAQTLKRKSEELTKHLELQSFCREFNSSGSRKQCPVNKEENIFG